MRSVTGHRLGLKCIDRGTDALGVLGVHLNKERKLAFDVFIRIQESSLGLTTQTLPAQQQLIKLIIVKMTIVTIYHYILTRVCASGESGR
jgi:hypothetical protein